jgi:hypothetical protein
MYNSRWGNWALATTHKDMFPSVGWQEDVEELLVWLAYYAVNDNGWTVLEDELYFYNYDSGYQSGVCWYETEGWADFIYVP